MRGLLKRELLKEQYAALISRRNSEAEDEMRSQLEKAEGRVIDIELALQASRERVEQIKEDLKRFNNQGYDGDIDHILNLDFVDSLEIEGSAIIVRTKALAAEGVIFGRYTITINLNDDHRLPIKVIADHPVPYKEFGDKAHHPFVYREEGKLCYGDSGISQIYDSGDIPLLIGSIIDFLQTPQYVHDIHRSVFRIFKKRQEEWQWC